MVGGEDVVAEPETVHRSGLEVLAHDIETAGQLDEELLAPRVLEVDADRALVEVVAQEGRPDAPAVRISHRRERPPARFTVARVLDLDHLRAESGQELRGVGERLHLLSGQDSHPVEGLAERNGVGIGDVTQVHGGDTTSERPGRPTRI